MSGRTPDDYAYLCSFTDEPRLQYVSGEQSLAVVPGSSVLGTPRFASASDDGHIAYVTIRDATEPEWVTTLVVLTKEFEPLDLIPGVAPYNPPAWSERGDRLCFLRFDPSTGSSWPVVYELSTGDEQPAGSPEVDLRGATWSNDRELVLCGSSWIDVVDLRSGERDRLYRWGVAEGFYDFGTDDEFVTIDQPARNGGSPIAVVVTWHREGKRGQEQVRVLRGGRLEPVRAGFSRRPMWRDDGMLVLSGEEGIEVWRIGTESACLETVRLKSLHSAAVARGSERRYSLSRPRSMA